VSRRLQQWIAASISVLLLAACANSSAALGGDPRSYAQLQSQNAAAKQQRADAHLQLALAYYQQSQWQVALDEATLALQIEPQQPDALSMRGLIYMASGRQALAGAEFQQALQIAPDQPDYLNNYAWFLCRTGQAQASLRWFEQAARQPDYETPEKALNNAGTCSLSIGERDAARNYFVRAAALQPGNVQSNLELAKLYLHDRDYPHAGFHAERAMAVEKPGVEALWLAIKVARKSEQPSTETQLLMQLRSLYPDSAEYAAYQRGAFDE
jgi:type IV pilus assembly protein PilF